MILVAKLNISSVSDESFIGMSMPLGHRYEAVACGSSSTTVIAVDVVFGGTCSLPGFHHVFVVTSSEKGMGIRFCCPLGHVTRQIHNLVFERNP